MTGLFPTLTPSPTPVWTPALTAALTCALNHGHAYDVTPVITHAFTPAHTVWTFLTICSIMVDITG